MHIKQLSKITGIPKRTIYFYIDEGILTPKVNSDNNYYDFSDEDCAVLQLVKKLRGYDLSVNAIKAILKEPNCLFFFLRKKIMENSIRSKQSESLNNLCTSIGSTSNRISILNECELLNPTEKEIPYDGLIVNHFMWWPFLPSDAPSDYQSYLLDKMDKIANSNKELGSDFHKINSFILNLKDEEVLSYYLGRKKLHLNIAELNENTIPDMVDRSIERIKKFLKNKKAISNWKKDYNDLILPEIHILLGTFLQLGREISPLFEKYVAIENEVCQKLYNYLSSEEGKTLKEELLNILENNIDIENNLHSELEVICWYSYS